MSITLKYTGCCLLLFLCITTSKGQPIPESYYYTIKTADSLYKLHAYRKAAETYSTAFALLDGKGHLNDRYSAACCWTLANCPDSAFWHLERLVSKGNYSNIKHISTDAELDQLHQDKRWNELLQQVRQNRAKNPAAYDDDLIDLLDSMEKQDQKWRLMLVDINNKKKDTLLRGHVLTQMMLTDSLNYFVLLKIVQQHGYPNYKLVGPAGAHNFWLMMQHQDQHPAFQESVLKLMKTEIDRGMASPSDYAYLLDRVKVNTGQKQVYGTQMQLNAAQTSYEPRDVIEPEKLNERRLGMGLSPIEDYIASMNHMYFGKLKK